jgi:hypothetical protein
MPKQRRASLASSTSAHALLSQYRPLLTREEAAAAITEHFFPIKPRTLERWPVSIRRLNGKACLLTREVFEEAQRRVDAAPQIAA